LSRRLFVEQAEPDVPVGILVPAGPGTVTQTRRGK
jgi:hypothetical protein